MVTWQWSKCKSSSWLKQQQPYWVLGYSPVTANMVTYIYSAEQFEGFIPRAFIWEIIIYCIGIQGYWIQTSVVYWPRYCHLCRKWMFSHLAVEARIIGDDTLKCLPGAQGPHLRAASLQPQKAECRPEQGQAALLFPFVRRMPSCKGSAWTKMLAVFKCPLMAPVVIETPHP